MTDDMRFLLIWIDFTVMSLAACAIVIVWAARAGQFRNQDHARYLPLLSGIPEEKKDVPAPGSEAEPKENKRDA